jgi:hypothetical protein
MNGEKGRPPSLIPLTGYWDRGLRATAAPLLPGIPSLAPVIPLTGYWDRGLHATAAPLLPGIP